MTKSHGKSKAKRESKTEKINRIEKECKDLQKTLDELHRHIDILQRQYQADTSSRHAYQASTYTKLSKAYDQHAAMTVELQQKKAEYSAAEAEHESSSDESKRSGHSRGSSRVSASSKSSNPATLGWDCGCGISNFNDPWGPDNLCPYGHRFCDNDNCCTVQWNP